MDKQKLQSLVDQQLTLREMARTLDCSKTNVSYWLKKCGLKVKRGARGKHPKDFVTKRKCKCGETRPEKFYGNKRTVCAKCHLKDTHERFRQNIVKARKFLGGKCKSCGFGKYQCALDFHHINPKEKDPRSRTMRGWSWKKIEKEIKKCILLCKNCHAALHSGIDIGV